MSTKAPWLALAIDWQDSEMLDDSSHGVRLAWICLLCHVKAQGRAGVVRIRGKAFAEHYRLSIESVEELLARASKAGAIQLEGEFVSVVNWKPYQDPKVRHGKGPQPQTMKRVTNSSRSFSKSAATPNQSPSTHHPPPTPAAKVANPSAPDPDPLSPEWEGAAGELVKCGVLAADDACIQARYRGGTPGEVRRLCEHFLAHPGAWSPGLLWSKVAKIRPSEKPSWPEPSTAFAEHQRTAELAAKRVERESAVAKQARERKEREALRAELDRESAENPFDAMGKFKQLIAGKEPTP